LFSTLKQSTHAESDMDTAMAAQILFWLLRAPDGHAKNFSVHLLAQGRFRLTPLYDVMSAYPVMGDGPSQWNPREVKLAMALRGKNKHYVMSHVLRRHFNSTAQLVGYGKDAEALIEGLLEKVPTAVARVRVELPPGFNAEVADNILDGFTNAAETLEGMPAT
jgi:serine/threonine-protein kinase HipA